MLVHSGVGFSVRKLIENGTVVPDIDELAERVTNDPLWVGDVISEDGQVGVIVVQPTDSKPGTDLVLTDTIGEILEPFRAEGFSYHIVGDGVSMFHRVAHSQKVQLR